MNKLVEEWKPVNGYEGQYEVSNFFNVKSLNYRRTGKTKLLKTCTNEDGYIKVILCKNGKTKHFSVHRLVAEAFMPNPDNKPQIDHIIPLSNGGKNELSNIRWVTIPENMNNPLTIQKFKNRTNPMLGKHHTEDSKKKMSEAKKGKKLPEDIIRKIAEKNSKKVYQYTLDGKLVKIWKSAKEAGRNGFDAPTIINCCNHKKNTKTHKGYIWSYSPL